MFKQTSSCRVLPEPIRRVYSIAMLGLLICGFTFSSGVNAAVPCGGSTDTEVPSLQIIDVDAMPWDTPQRGRAWLKTVCNTEQNGRVVLYFFQPTWDTILHPAGTPGNPAYPHYHLHHEWGFVLSGDYILHEGVSPDQRNPAVRRYIEGTWLARQAYSLHSGDWATGGLRAQNPSAMILLEEGDTSITLLPDGTTKTSVAGSDSAPESGEEPDWDKISIAHPWLVDTGSAMEWEQDQRVDGRFVKWLSDNPVQGFRAQLVKIPPGWTPPEGRYKTYFKKANRIRYILYGDLNVWNFSDAQSEGVPEKVGKDVFVYQPAGSIWGYGPGPVSDDGAVWLEVTYADGLAIGGGPIEEPTVIR